MCGKILLTAAELSIHFEDPDYDDDGSNDDGAGWDSEGDERLREIRQDINFGMRTSGEVEKD